MIVHIGEDATSGHYIYYGYNVDGWYKFDDKHVVKVHMKFFVW